MKKLNLFFVLILSLLLMTACNNVQKDTAQVEQTETPDTEKSFQLIDVKELEDNPVSLFADNWFVVTGGTENDFNQMTISWGTLGNIWEEPCVTIYIRNTRHTYPYLQNNKHFTLCAFDEEYREKVLYIGSNSGRDVNKIEATGLTPKTTESGNVYYDEARLVIECEKVYFGDIIKANLTAPKGVEMYKDLSDDIFHTMFVGKILNIWEKK